MNVKVMSYVGMPAIAHPIYRMSLFPGPEPSSRFNSSLPQCFLQKRPAKRQDLAPFTFRQVGVR